MQSGQSQAVEQCGHTVEHLEHTVRPHGPPGFPAFPGHLFSAVSGHSGALAQHPTLIEIELLIDLAEAIDADLAECAEGDLRSRLSGVTKGKLGIGGMLSASSTITRSMRFGGDSAITGIGVCDTATFCIVGWTG